MPKNEKLSHWSAWLTCYCGRWTVCTAPQRSPGGLCWERDDETRPGASTKLRTWRVIPDGHEWVGPATCEACGYDLTRGPADNIRAITDDEWLAGTIVGSNLACEGTKPADFLPDLPLVFERCNLDNVVLPKQAVMVPATEAGRACSHNRIVVQNDREDWVCKWADDSPVQPADLKGALRDGRNTDPRALPTAAMTETDVRSAQDARREAAEIEEARAKVAAYDAKRGED